MDAIGKLAGGVAHDFNNLLTIIKGYAELVIAELDETNPITDDVQLIFNTATQASKLTRQLLAFSRKQPLILKTININESVFSLLKMLKRLIGENITIDTKLSEDVSMISADIDQVIMNLVINARDAMPDGGIIEVETKNIDLPEDDLDSRPDVCPGEYICLDIRDTGMGMDELTVQRIFEPFFTNKENGTGLGLSVVYGIVQQHGGFIEVSSVPGKGSAFKVYLPAISAVQGEIKETVSFSINPQGKGERILIVEDEDYVRNLVKNILVKNGYHVFWASNVKEAIQTFEREEGDFNLIFSDVVLPDGNGIQLVDQLHARKPLLHVLLSSGYLDSDSRWDIISDRGFQFLPKPFAVTDVLKSVKKALTTRPTVMKSSTHKSEFKEECVDF